MTLEELEAKKKEIREQAENDQRILDGHYAMEHAEWKVGDIITRFSGERMIIERISFGYLSGKIPKEPVAIYKGLRVKKDNTPFKSNEQCAIYQNNIVEGEHRS